MKEVFISTGCYQKVDTEWQTNSSYTREKAVDEGRTYRITLLCKHLDLSVRVKAF